MKQAPATDNSCPALHPVNYMFLLLNDDLSLRCLGVMHTVYYSSFIHEGECVMSTTTISIRTDREIKAKSQKIFESIGLDIRTICATFSA
jgi:hypothetical protein